MADLLKEKPVELTDLDGKPRKFIVSRIPSVQCREILAEYFQGFIPKVGEYRKSEAMMFKLLSYVAVKHDSGELIRLTTPDLINNHTGDWEALAKLEMAMINYNSSFFSSGRISTFLDEFARKLLRSGTGTSTESTDASLAKEKQPSTS